MNRFDVDHFSPTESLLVTTSLEETLRWAAACASVDAEEDMAAESTRPTIPVFDGAPWQ